MARPPRAPASGTMVILPNRVPASASWVVEPQAVSVGVGGTVVGGTLVGVGGTDVGVAGAEVASGVGSMGLPPLPVSTSSNLSNKVPDSRR